MCVCVCVCVCVFQIKAFYKFLIHFCFNQNIKLTIPDTLDLNATFSGRLFSRY